MTVRVMIIQAFFSILVQFFMSSTDIILIPHFHTLPNDFLILDLCGPVLINLRYTFIF